jgi:polar amino acid transport system ATP-binding protein/sulfate transport system ATP-binding protein
MTAEYTVDGTILSVDNARISLGGRLIVRDAKVSIENIVRPNMAQGQVVGLLGPSGAGKTTLVNGICGEYALDSGQILIRRKDVEKLPGYASMTKGEQLEPTRRGRVGIVSQNYRVFRHLTVLGNLLMAGHKAGLTKAEAKDKAEALLNQFDLLERKDFWPMSAQLSGGQRQRLAILQQIMVGHQIICMDEPVSGLDPRQKNKVIKLIRDITSVNELLTIIVITHDIASAVAVSDHLWLMGKDRDGEGRIIEGARILSVYDLIAMDLAWHENIQSMPQFRDLVSQITERFETLV